MKRGIFECSQIDKDDIMRIIKYATVVHNRPVINES